MNEFDREIQKAISREQHRIPDSVEQRIEKTLSDLPPRMKRNTVRKFPRILVTAACLAVVLLGVLPNVSVAYAKAIDDIPVIGTLARVFTIRNYNYDNGGYDLDADIPAIIDPENKEAESLINADINELTGAAIDQFYRELTISTNDGHGSVHIDYDILTNSENWFTLKLSVTETVASSYSYEKYYHIDRTTGAYVNFGDLFDSARYAAMEDLVIGQMERRMAEDPEQIYWTERSGTSGCFTALTDNQNFYFREDGALVIVFDRYAAAPGYMGCPQFTLTAEEYTPFLR